MKLNEYARAVHENAVAHGWYDEAVEFPEVAALIHSEISEALAEYREGNPLIYGCCGIPGAVCEFEETCDKPENERTCKPEGLAVELCDDKMLTLIAVSGAGIPMPESIASPLMYSESEDKAFLDGVERRLGYPIVVKKAYGSMGTGVYLANDRAELETYFRALRLVPHLYQKRIGRGGEDIRVTTIGGKAVAAMRRKNDGDFRSNIERGGKGEAVVLTKRQKAIAEKASALLKLEYAGVDLLADEEGDYLCEVNSNAFFEGIERATGVDVAKGYAERVYDRIYRGKR